MRTHYWGSGSFLVKSTLEALSSSLVRMSMPSVLESGLRSRQKQYWGICASSADYWLFLAGALIKKCFLGTGDTRQSWSNLYFFIGINTVYLSILMIDAVMYHPEWRNCCPDAGSCWQLASPLWEIAKDSHDAQGHTPFLSWSASSNWSMKSLNARPLTPIGSSSQLPVGVAKLLMFWITDQCCPILLSLAYCFSLKSVLREPQ